MNKWNAREFAARQGVAVPRLYWAGHHGYALPFNELPSSYVLRMTTGANGKGVLLIRDGVELKSGANLDSEEQRGWVDEKLRSAPGKGMVLAEELLESENEEDYLPANYRLFTFLNNIEMIGVTYYRESLPPSICYFSPDWTPLDYPVRPKPCSGYAPPPLCLSEMKAAARTLGCAFGTFTRIDMYATKRGCVFGEFAPDPFKGWVSAEADAVLNAAWEKHCSGNI
jgi:hypothetical protein